MKRAFLLAIEGVIGVGKTSLARLLQPRFKAELVLEAFDRNPFLPAFYADRERYAFQTQIFFLLSRFRQQQTIPRLLANGPVITDYIFAKDSLFAHLNLRGDELELYERLYELLASRVGRPDLVVYLRADIDVLMARIAARDRPYERTMPRDYIETVWAAYERYFASYTETPLLVMNMDALDYVQRPADLDAIERQIRAHLAVGAYQQPLPQFALTDLPLSEQPDSPPCMTFCEEDTATEQRRTTSDFLALSEAFGQVATSYAAHSRQPTEQNKIELKRALAHLIVTSQRFQEALGNTDV